MVIAVKVVEVIAAEVTMVGMATDNLVNAISHQQYMVWHQSTCSFLCRKDDVIALKRHL